MWTYANNLSRTPQTQPHKLFWSIFPELVSLLRRGGPYQTYAAQFVIIFVAAAVPSRDFLQIDNIDDEGRLLMRLHPRHTLAVPRCCARCATPMHSQSNFQNDAARAQEKNKAIE